MEMGNTADEVKDDTRLWSHLPQEIVLEVVLRLPIKSLLRFRAVCKRWKAMVSDSGFVTKQIQTSVASDRHARLVTRAVDGRVSSSSIHSICQNPYNFEVLNLSCPVVGADHQLDMMHFDVLASCNGLLLARFGVCEHLLWNPATREVRKLPSVPWVFEFLTDVYESVGFAYDEVNDDYKVLVFFSDAWHGERKLCTIYSTRSDEWRPVDHVPGGIENRTDPGIALNGSLHWISCDNVTSRRSIVALNISTEEVKEIGLPDYGTKTTPAQKLWVFKESLCVIASKHIRSKYELWVMKDYGFVESWSLMYQIPCWRTTYYDSHPEFLWCSKDGKLLIWFLSTWLVFDTKRCVISRGSPSPNHSIRPVVCYVESLVSPNKV
uniref:F-box domain-containing protein n=1 Tax=Kalanchoe fedtschenkoi TaxID=63787 RepID=A0A7N0UZC5_KALFE